MGGGGGSGKRETVSEAAELQEGARRGDGEGRVGGVRKQVRHTHTPHTLPFGPHLLHQHQRQVRTAETCRAPRRKDPKSGAPGLKRSRAAGAEGCGGPRDSSAGVEDLTRRDDLFTYLLTYIVYNSIAIGTLSVHQVARSHM